MRRILLGLRALSAVGLRNVGLFGQKVIDCFLAAAVESSRRLVNADRH